MSLFDGLKKIGKSILKVAAPVAGAYFGGPVGASIGGSLTAGIGPDGVYSGKKPLSSIPGLGFTQDPRTGSNPWGALDPRTKGSIGDYLIPDYLQAPTGAGGAAPYKVLRSGKVRYARRRADGSWYYPRRMNPLNPSAARRSIRRIKAVRRITRDIERSLPRVTTRARRAA